MSRNIEIEMTDYDRSFVQNIKKLDEIHNTNNNLLRQQRQRLYYFLTKISIVFFSLFVMYNNWINHSNIDTRNLSTFRCDCRESISNNVSLTNIDNECLQKCSLDLPDISLVQDAIQHKNTSIYTITNINRYGLTEDSNFWIDMLICMFMCFIVESRSFIKKSYPAILEDAGINDIENNTIFTIFRDIFSLIFIKFSYYYFFADLFNQFNYSDYYLIDCSPNNSSCSVCYHDNVNHPNCTNSYSDYNYTNQYLISGTNANNIHLLYNTATFRIIFNTIFTF